MDGNPGNPGKLLFLPFGLFSFFFQDINLMVYTILPHETSVYTIPGLSFESKGELALFARA